MNIVERCKSSKKFLILTLIVGIFALAVWYIAVPALLLWWLIKTPRISKRAKIITGYGIAGMLGVLIILSGIAYARDTEPSLKVSEPAANATTQAEQIWIKGTYTPADRTVWINKKEIHTANGHFAYQYQLQNGKNNIIVEAGNWKRATITLTVTRKFINTNPSATPQSSQKPAEKPEATPIVTPAVDPKKEIENAVRKSVDSETNFKTSNIRSVEVVSRVDGGYGVLVDFNANDNLTTRMIKLGIWSDMTDIYTALYKKGSWDIKSVTLFAYFPTTDKYGNSSDSVVLKSTLDQSEANKVNWDQSESTLATQILPNVCTVDVDRLN